MFYRQQCLIGEDTHLWPKGTLYYGVKIANRVIIHSGVIIGSDGFGLAEKNEWRKIPHIGLVIIHNDVEIGANTTIDRGALGDTVIEEGVKLDNQIQVAHNVNRRTYSNCWMCWYFGKYSNWALLYDWWRNLYCRPFANR